MNEVRATEIQRTRRVTGSRLELASIVRKCELPTRKTKKAQSSKKNYGNKRELRNIYKKNVSQSLRRLHCTGYYKIKQLTNFL